MFNTIYYKHNILKGFNIENSKKWIVHMLHSKEFSESQMAFYTCHENDRMSLVPYALDIGSIMNAMTCAYSDVSDGLSIVRLYYKFV